MKRILFIAAMVLLSLQSCDKHEGYGHVAISNKVKQTLEAKYPGARIIESDYEYGYLEVDIRHDSREKTVRFDDSDEWMDTRWDIRVSEIPQAVKNAIAASEYASYRIDDADYIQAPAGDYCKIELERAEHEVMMRIGIDGTVM